MTGELNGLVVRAEDANREPSYGPGPVWWSCAASWPPRQPQQSGAAQWRQPQQLQPQPQPQTSQRQSTMPSKPSEIAAQATLEAAKAVNADRRGAQTGDEFRRGDGLDVRGDWQGENDAIAFRRVDRSDSDVSDGMLDRNVRCDSSGIGDRRGAEEGDEGRAGDVEKQRDTLAALPHTTAAVADLDKAIAQMRKEGNGREQRTMMG